jgi:thiol-disulfide isomerase/thioredoxin
MRRSRPLILLSLVTLLATSFTLASTGQSPAPPSVDVQIVKYGDLTNFVSTNKGKVILLDFWATTCIPCKESFFHTVEMAKKYSGKGLVVASVSTDAVEPGEEAKLKARVLRFLQGQDAAFTNVILNEPADVIRSKLRMESIPCIYVFNRDGQWTQFIGDKLEPEPDHRHRNVEEYVAYCLEQTAKK